MTRSQLNPADVDGVLATLHAKKSAVYGDAWRKRGELLSIFPNIARKYDRLENAAKLGELVLAADGLLGATVEPLLDTVADLAIYALKYLTFLTEQQSVAFPGDLDPTLFADFKGALRQTREGLPHLLDAPPVDGDLNETFGGISGEMARIEQILVEPGTGIGLSAKVPAVFALAAFSLVLLDQLAFRIPTAWAAFVAQIDEL